MSRKKLKRFELSADYYVTVARGTDPDTAGDRIFTFSGAGVGSAPGISLLAHEIERLIPILHQAREEMIREASSKMDAADAQDWGAAPEMT